jgi:hypothetical protein
MQARERRRGARSQATGRLEAGAGRLWRGGRRNGEAVAMTRPDRGAAEIIEVERADPAKPVVPLIAAPIPAATVPAMVIVAMRAGGTELRRLHGRQTCGRHESYARLGSVGARLRGQRQTGENAQGPARHDSPSAWKAAWGRETMPELRPDFLDDRSHQGVEHGSEALVDPAESPNAPHFLIGRALSRKTGLPLFAARPNARRLSCARRGTPSPSRRAPPAGRARPRAHRLRPAS